MRFCGLLMRRSPRPGRSHPRSPGRAREQLIHRLLLAIADGREERRGATHALEGRQAPLEEVLQPAEPGGMRRSTRQVHERPHDGFLYDAIQVLPDADTSDRSAAHDPRADRRRDTPQHTVLR